MITEDLKIPTETRPIEAFAMYKEVKPKKAFLILPGKGYTINHFLLDFLWRMAAESGLYAIKAEYRGYTYRHLNEPYDYEHAAADIKQIIRYLENQGYKGQDIIVCAKSLGTIALSHLTAYSDITFNKAILLTPVLYLEKGKGVFPQWAEYNKKVKNSYLVFGSDDPYCDLESAKDEFPQALIGCYEGADHGLHLVNNFSKTIEIQQEIIQKVQEFILA